VQTMTTDQRDAALHWQPNGRLLATDTTEGDRLTSVCLHLSPLLFIPLSFLFPLVPVLMWLTMRDRSTFINDHGREQINFMISFVLLHVLLGITIIGAILMPVLWVVGAIGIIRGAIAAGRSEYYRYPVTFRFIS